MKIRSILLGLLLLMGLPGSPLQAQTPNLIYNGTFDINTPSSPNCDLSPWGWQTSTYPVDSPLSAVQWTDTAHTSWWVDLTDCTFGNGRWIKQSVTTVAGQTYIIGLDILAQAWFPAGVDVYLNGAFVRHFENQNNGTPSIPDWERFEFCWTATGTSTEIKLVANSYYSLPVPIIGIDDVVMIDTDSIPFEITLSNRCVPAVVGFQTPVNGYPVWYKNGNLFISGQNSINANLPGTYQVKYITLCGDTLSKDTVVIDCDTCKPEVNIHGYCEGEPTYFNFDFGRYCADPSCIGSVSVDYGDGSTEVINMPAQFNFSHTYSTAGTYTVAYCWADICTGKTKCITVTTVIADCRCEPEVVVQNFCSGDTTTFQFTYDTACVGCIGDMYIHYGDGSSDYNGPSFGHLYAAPGSYMVRYCWYNFCENRTYCDSFIVIIEDCCVPPVDVQGFCLGETTTFQFNVNPECVGCIGDMTIDFGDGIMANSGSPYSFSHFYAAPGTYTVTYCWYNLCMDQTYCKTFTVTIIECACEPLEDVQQFCLGQATDFQLTFDPSCANCIFNLTVDYGDGVNVVVSAPYNFSHTYAATGVYYVTYCWANSCNGQSYCKTITVTIVHCPCEPVEVVEQFCLGAPTNFQFNFGECENCIGSMSIDYGDGNIESKSSPFIFSHTYSVPGTYPVTYCWVDLCKEQSFCKTIWVTITECNCEPAPNVYQFCLGQPTYFDFLFDENCLPCIGQMTIDYGDQTMTLVPGAPYSFQHWYPAVGNYTISYCWTNTCTGATTCKTITITIIDCQGGGGEPEPAPNSVTETPDNSMSLFPNPAQNKVTLRGITAEKGLTKVEVVSIDGKVMLSLPVKSGSTELDIALDKLSSGTYLIRVIGEQPTVNLKLIKE